jgi:hypothetical protein
LKKETGLCPRVFKDKVAVREEPVREEEEVVVADLRIVSVATAESERLINRANLATSRNVQNAGELCEESKLISVYRVPLTIPAVRNVGRSLQTLGFANLPERIFSAK